MCCTGKNYYYNVYIKKLYLNMNTQEARIPSVSPHTPVSIHSYLTASAYTCLLHVRIADRIKNREPYQCLSLTRVFLASKTPLLIADHLRAILSTDLPVKWILRP